MSIHLDIVPALDGQTQIWRNNIVLCTHCMLMHNINYNNKEKQRKKTTKIYGKGGCLQVLSV